MDEKTEFLLGKSAYNVNYFPLRYKQTGGHYTIEWFVTNKKII